MKDTQLLSDLKACSEMGVVFEEEEWLSDLTHEKLCEYSGSFTIMNDKNYYKVPTVEWVEGNIRDFLAPDELLIIIYAVRISRYIVQKDYDTFPAYDHSFSDTYSFKNKEEQLSKAVSLLRCLKKSQTDRSE